MPNAPLSPGVYVEEVPSGVRTITGVPTSIAAFIGAARKGPLDEPVDITSFADYERLFGGLSLDGTMGYAVRDFFLNGGSQAVMVRISGPETAAGDFIGDETGQRGLYALEKLFATDGIFNLLCIPPYTAGGDVDAA